MKTIFISQPMNGLTDEEIVKERDRVVQYAQEMLTGEDVQVIDSFFRGAPTYARPLWFLGKSLELLSMADIAYFAPGWDKARGCLIEHESALQYDIPVIEVPEREVDRNE